MPDLPHALIVAGPTASGKSALALAIAERLGGTVVNADSMQVYRELRILTARPTPDEEARVPHALYGVRPAAEAGSAAWWRGEALRAVATARAEGRLPILCGGTGLYFSALTEGLAEIPEPDPDARAEARRLLAEFGPRGLHAALAKVDQATAARLRPSDSQRVARAWEVWRGTGRGLVAAIAGRFTAMLDAGALEEARALQALRLDPALPAMRAHGVPELLSHLRGEITIEEAARRAELVTGQYSKRQATWFRHHTLSEPARTHTIHAQTAELEKDSERCMAEMFSFIRAAG
jgi:tRNA dimethylallyltransferase